MRRNRITKELMSGILAAALFLYPNTAVLAAEVAAPPGQTLPVTQTAQTLPVTEPTETVPETTAATVPEETVPETAAATVPEETVPATTAATVPEETVPETTAATVPEETIPETTAATVPEELPPVTQPTQILPVEQDAASAPVLAALLPENSCTIAEARAMSAGTEGITIQGTVVFVMNTQAILQDETGGIRLAFSEAPQICPGDTLLVCGSRSGGLSVRDFSVTGRAALPALTTTLTEAEEEIRLHIPNAVLGRQELSQNGTSYSLTAQVPEGLAAGDRVDAFGVLLDGWFYADTLLPAALPEEESADDWQFYFGQLHAHTSLSSGSGTPEEAYAAAKAAGLDFFALTEHSNSFDNADDGAIGLEGSTVSREWAAGKAAAEAVTDDGFVGLFGYEMTWGEDMAIGHISTFRTPGWQTREQPGFDALKPYYQALASIPGSISQFNHPGPHYGDFDRFQDYDPAYDAVMQLIEVGSGEGQTAYDAYRKALDAGWHLAPTNSQATHDGSFASGTVRTVILATSLTEESLYDAMAQRRVYATEDSDLEILYTMNGQIMGSILPTADSLTIDVSLSDPTDLSVGTVEVLGFGGVCLASQTVSGREAALTMTVPSGSGYYYLRITQPDGDIAVTAPIWADDFSQLGIEAFEAEFPEPEVGQEIALQLTLFNGETEDLLLESVVFSQNGVDFYVIEAPGTVPALGCRSFTAPYLCEKMGKAEITVRVSGTVAGLSRSDQQTLTIHGQVGDLAVSDIAAVRGGLLGEPYRIRGYVTAGTSNPHNTFPDTLYIQDDTGGIAVTDFTDTGIQVGTPIDLTGVLRRVDGNIVLALTDYDLPAEACYRHVPRTMAHAVAMNYDAHGGELLQIEGSVVSLKKTEDGKGIARFTIRDIRGDLATVMIEDTITSGAYGTNELASQVKKGRTVRAMGLLHIDEFGQTVLRVRNCEEVVYVPPKVDPTNPKTGDWLTRISS